MARTARTPAATNDSHDSKCNAMQHNATQCSRAITNTVGGNTRCGISRLSQKRAQPNGSADLSDACRPITKQTQSARQPTIRTIQNATQCNTMLTRHYESK